MHGPNKKIITISTSAEIMAKINGLTAYKNA